MDGDQKPIGQALDGDEAPASSLPSATFTPSRSEPPAGISGETEAERNAVFAELVTGDADIVGLIAYSIYKQNKLDWLVAFNRLKGRDPNDAEAAAYIVGESTARRLAIYRHLAQATLEGRGPEVTTTGGSGPAAPRNYAIAARHQSSGSPTAETGRGTLLAIAALVLVVLVGFYFAAKFGLPGVTPSR